jgi:exopolyphosphatase / guanosine-5'-triphosphate,3'-diphosphate pyrophosphatase
MAPVAAIDCGTNSIRLLIADHGPDDVLVDLDRRLEVVRLGQGIDATGEFHPDALTRTFAVVDQYATLIANAGIASADIHFVATSAARDARNRQEFFDGIERRLGVVPDVISGDDEARLSFTGALSTMRPKAEPVLVTDIGGGSTELIVGTAEGEIGQAISLDIGSVRLTERFLRAGPPAPGDLDRAIGYVDEMLAGSGIDLAQVRTWIGVAGTITTLAGVFLKLSQYDRSKVHGSVMPRTELDRLLNRLATMTVEEIRRLPSMHPQRADVITGGAVVAARIAHAVSAEDLIVSETDILDGIALALLAR